jgi:3-phenylpropionate/trans-cinnamate dioxygenase ferredoxin subunit
MSEWIKIDDESKFDGEVKVYSVNDSNIAVFKLEDGYYAIDNSCSHEEASLAEGEIEDGEVECPLHGARFDIRTGKNLSFPAVIPVKSYQVKVENSEIFLHVEE